MPATEPTPNRAPNYIVTADDWNAILNNLRNSMQVMVTQKGDIAIGIADKTIGILPKPAFTALLEMDDEGTGVWRKFSDLKVAASQLESSTSADKAKLLSAVAPGLIALEDAANIAWDLETQPNAQVTITENRTMAAPTNGVIGRAYILHVVQDFVGGNALRWNEAYGFDYIGGTPTISTGGSARDVLGFLQIGEKLECVAHLTA